MIVIFIRTTVIFITLMVVMRLMGKRQIGEMQAFELVMTLIIAEIACLPLADVSIPLIYGVVAILALFVIHQITSLLEKAGVFKQIINGKPSVVINKNGIDFEELNRNNVDAEELLELLRSNGAFGFEQVDYAIFESSGKLSILQKENAPTPSLTFTVIANGKIVNKNVEILNLSDKWLNELLESRFLAIKDIAVMTLSQEGGAYLQTRRGKVLTFNVSMKTDQQGD